MSTRTWSHTVPQSSYHPIFSSVLVHKKSFKPQFGERKGRSLGQPPCPPRKSWGMALAQFPRNPRRNRQELRWALEHQAMTRKHVWSGHPIADSIEGIRVMSDGPRRTRSILDGVSKAGDLERNRRSAMENKSGHAIDSGQSL